MVVFLTGVQCPRAETCTRGFHFGLCHLPGPAGEVLGGALCPLSISLITGRRTWPPLLSGLPCGNPLSSLEMIQVTKEEGT